MYKDCNLRLFSKELNGFSLIFKEVDDTPIFHNVTIKNSFNEKDENYLINEPYSVPLKYSKEVFKVSKSNTFDAEFETKYIENLNTMFSELCVVDFIQEENNNILFHFKSLIGDVKFVHITPKDHNIVDFDNIYDYVKDSTFTFEKINDKYFLDRDSKLLLIFLIVRCS